MMARFDFAYKKAFDHFERMERIQNQFNNTINPLQWPTISEIADPVTFVAVEEQLPFAMRYLNPKKRGIQLVPERHALPAERIHRVEENLRYTLRTEMKLEDLMLIPVKDCFKFAVGYALIDPASVTPPEIAVNEIYLDGNRLEARRVMGVGKPKLVPQFRYMTPIQVIPMPDGAEPDGPNRASGFFVVDFVHEQDFRDMYEPVETTDGPKPLYKGDPEAIIEKARSQNFDSRMPSADIIKTLANLDLAVTNQGEKKMPVVVPIVRCYFKHEQHWIANGRTLIWSKKESFQTLRSNLVKFSAWKDGKEWFPLGVTEASERLAYGQNIWWNAMVDLAMYHMKPTRIINEQQLSDNRSLQRGPDADVRVSGDVNSALRYMELPAMGNDLFALGNHLQDAHGKANAKMPNSFSAPGLVRGGGHALEAMLQSSTGRQLLAACILKTGGYQATVEHTLALMQMLIGEPGNTIVISEDDPVTGETDYIERTTTLEDMRNTFRVELNFPDARWNSALAMQEETAFFDRCEKHPELFDTIARYEELAGDDDKMKRITLPASVVKEREDRLNEARIQAAERGETQPAAAGGETVQADQGLAGAAALGT